jgi:hypothetical protein
MNLIIRLLTAALGVLALLVVAALWLSPDASAQRFGLSISGAAGRAIIRADVAGLFLALGVLSLLAAAYRRSDLSRAALLLTAAVYVGRIINLFVVGVTPDLLAPVGLEMVMLAVYFGGMRIWK